MIKYTLNYLMLILLFSEMVFASANEIPLCISLNSSDTIESTVTAKHISSEELLTRLVYAESKSTGFNDEPLIYQAIAWGVMNRVLLGEASRSMQRNYGNGIYGVIFKKGQFNPAVSKKSKFSKDFLCPDNDTHWNMAKSAANRAIKGENNPFIKTPWEKKHGISLVVNFYYPKSVQAKTPLSPWEDNKALAFIGDINFGDQILSSDRIRFYRLVYFPSDVLTSNY